MIMSKGFPTAIPTLPEIKALTKSADMEGALFAVAGYQPAAQAD